MARPTHDLHGKVFGRLTVWSKATSGKGGASRWDCLCVCGTFTTAYATSLIYGNTKSCGCLAKEMASVRITSLTPEQRLGRLTHGASRRGALTPTFKIWLGISKRCYQKTDKNYPDYGGRGIRVCKRWRGPTGYANFLADMGEKPDGMSIDRKNNDLGYSPSNCRWATAKEQRANRRPLANMLTNGVCRNGHPIATEADYYINCEGSAVCRKCGRARSKAHAEKKRLKRIL